MEVQAITKNINTSAQKMREVVRQIQGLPALQAAAILSFMPGKRATVVAKTLKSAIANAEIDPRVRNAAGGFAGAVGDLPAYTNGGSTLLVFALPHQQDNAHAN